MLKGLPLTFSLLASFVGRTTALDPNLTSLVGLESGLQGEFPNYNRFNSLGRRQQVDCVTPGWTPCSNAYLSCCPKGYICQPNNPDGMGEVWCCPPADLQCGGKACCKPGLGFCCGTNCCLTGMKCSNGKCTKPPSSTKPTSTSTRSSFTIPSNFPTSPLCTQVGVRDVFGRQVEDCPGQVTKSSSIFPTPTETRIPKATMTFDYQRVKVGNKRMSITKQQERESAVDQLFQSMCRGLKALGKTSNAIFTFTDDKKLKALNRAKAGCTGSLCKTGTSGTSCDEFPFASTTDSGAGPQVASCIVVLAQNIQGGIISSFTRRNKITNGDHYKFQITGYDCNTNSPTPGAAFTSDNDKLFEQDGVSGEPRLSVTRRDLIPGGLGDEQLESYPPFAAEDMNNTVIQSIGDLQSGTYTINARVNQGTVSDLRVIDYLGDEYARADVVLGDDGMQTISFTMDFGGVGIGFFMDTQLDSVNVSSNMLIGPPNSGSLASLTPHSSLVFVIIVVAVMMTYTL